MAEKEAAHRHSQDKIILETNGKIAIIGAKEVIIGQVFGLVIGLSAIGAGTFLAYTGHELAGGLIGVGAIVGMASVFVIGRSKQGKDKSAD